MSIAEIFLLLGPGAHFPPILWLTLTVNTLSWQYFNHPKTGESFDDPLLGLVLVFHNFHSFYSLDLIICSSLFAGCTPLMSAFWETDACQSLGVWGQACLCKGYQASHSCTVRPLCPSNQGRKEMVSKKPAKGEIFLKKLWNRQKWDLSNQDWK